MLFIGYSKGAKRSSGRRKSREAMDRILARSGVRLQSSRVQNNQDGSDPYESSSSSSSSEDRGRDILLRLLQQIAAFLERKEMMSTRIAASNEWNQSLSRRRSKSSNNNLFEVIIDVCEQWMRRLKHSTLDGREDKDWSSESPRQLVAEAIIQELLVSLMKLRIEEKENMVMHEVECVEIMRQLYGHLQKDEEVVRSKVCIAAGDEQQLNELQIMLRNDFLEELSNVESPARKQQLDSAENNEASLQFAWETIDDQKKEIIRLRADNERLRDSSSYGSTSTQSFFQENYSEAIKVLRSQLSSHQVENLNILHNYIQRLEKTLQSASTTSHTTQREGDNLHAIVNLTRSSDTLLSRSAISSDFSRTQVHSERCGECRKNSASLFALRSQCKQLRAQAERDEDSLLQAEKERNHQQQENSALSSALLLAKQKQEELRQTIIKVTQEKHDLQNLSDSEQRTSERSLQMLQEQLNIMQEQKAYVKQKFDDLKSKYDFEVSEKLATVQKLNDLQVTHSSTFQSITKLQCQIKDQYEAAQKWEALVKERDGALNDVYATVTGMEHEIVARTAELQEKGVIIADLRIELGDLQRRLDAIKEEKCTSANEVERLLGSLDECKRKNQRLEKGFEELQQGKELLASLQQIERETAVSQVDELKQTRETLDALKVEHVSTQFECTRLGQALADAKEAKLAFDTTRSLDVKRMQHELDTVIKKCVIHEQELTRQKAIQSKLTTTIQEQRARATDLSNELDQSKTELEMWVTKCDSLDEDNFKLKNQVQSLHEEQSGLKEKIEMLSLECETKCLKLYDQENALKNEILMMTERHQSMERERRSLENEKRTLLQLVQTLQARPELQQRVFSEMLMTCQRGTERVFYQLSERLVMTLKKMSAAEKQLEALRLCLAERKAFCGSENDGDNIASPKIVIHKEDFSSSSVFALSNSQPTWLDSVISSEEPQFFDISQRIMPTDTAMVSNDEPFVDLKQSTTIHLLTWHKLITTMTNRRLDKLQNLSTVMARRLSKELLRSIQAQCLAKWRSHAQAFRYYTRSSASPTLVSALASCIHLIRSLCESPRKTLEGEVSEQAKYSLDCGSDELTKYLIEIKLKVGGWKVAADCRIAQYAKQSNQLKVVQRKCADLKDLVGLNQRLIEEMERRTTGQQKLVEAAWTFATAFQALSPSARARVFQSRDLLSASMGILQGLSSLGISCSVNKFSQTLGPKMMQRANNEPTMPKIVTVLSSSAASGVKTGTDIVRSENDRKQLNSSNIELLEEAVLSLKRAMQQQRSLQLKLKEKKRLLTITTKKLHECTMQFLLLRSFLQWKRNH
ncbi:hypothetical protein Plhal304r1_c009g0036351 [Plasmopara halstedii]